jgi:PKD repeat protein
MNHSAQQKESLLKSNFSCFLSQISRNRKVAASFVSFNIVNNMKIIFILLITICFQQVVFSQSHLQKPQHEKALIDTMIFDINQAVFTSVGSINYIEFPVILKSSNTGINSFDFWFQFNLNKLTYESTSAIIGGLDAFSNFNSANLYLSNTSSGTSISFIIPTNIPVIKLKFQLATACTQITQADFSNVTTLFNGDVSSHKFVAPTQEPIELVSSSPLCSNNDIVFTYPSTYNGSTITTYAWDFGNGDLGNSQTDSTQFTAGAHNVTLTVTTVDGCTNTVTKDLTVIEGPNAGFNAVFDANFNSFNFINESTILSGAINSYLWDFGDVTPTSNLENPSHTYQSQGSFLVSLTVTADNGCANVYDSLVSTTDGINELLFNQFELSPNPTTNTCQIHAKHGFVGELELRDVNGQLVYTTTFQGNNQSIDLTGLSAGVYFCNIHNKLGQRSLKVIKL